MTPEAHARSLARFRSALGAGIARDLERTRRRRQRMRLLSLAGVVAAVALALVLAQPFERGQSSIARARAAIEVLPTTGILHVVSRDGSGAIAEEVWQNLSNTSEFRRFNAEPAGEPEESALADGRWMRFDAVTDTVYTQRVIEARGAFSEDVNVPHVAGLLARPGIRDLGIEELAGQRVRRLQLPGAQGAADSSCDYDVDAVTFLPARLACTQDGHSTGVTTYAVVPDTPANHAQLSLVAAHPHATVAQDPNGIPGKAGTALADVTAPGIVDVTAGKAYLQQTTEDAMRRARLLEVALNSDLEGCFLAHGARRMPLTLGQGYTFDDPTGTVGAICQHFGDSGNAVRATPAGSALTAREVAQAEDVAACIEARHPTAAERAAVGQDCESQNPDPFLASLPAFS